MHIHLKYNFFAFNSLLARSTSVGKLNFYLTGSIYELYD